MLPLVVLASLVLGAQAPAPDTAAPPARSVFALPDMRGLIEGIAFRPATGDYYFGDVHLRCVWRRTADGRVTRFSAPDDRLLGVFRIAVDEARGALWASMGALEQMEGFGPAVARAGGLAELDLATGAVRRVITTPSDGAPHLLGDFVQLADGTIYATDTTTPVIWTLAPGSRTLVPLISGGFKSLQGITLDADGHGLFVTDYRVGVLRVDMATKAVRPLTAPAGADLRGLDTLLRTPDGALVAIFNATPRQRILRLTLDADATAITRIDILAADASMTDGTLGILVGDDLVFVADGGWNRFEPGKVDPSPRPVPVLKIPWAARPR